jgi:selenocysteine lyase/cysteine desulfurase
MEKTEMETNLVLEKTRAEIIGRDLLFETPYGERNLFYADYTASGRGVSSIEKALYDIQRAYANTHTEDDYSGKYLTGLLHTAEERIKSHVNAGPMGKIFSVGSGSTGALKKLQEIIGVFIPPATRERISRTCGEIRGNGDQVIQSVEKNKPVVFIGPYEHHTNELMWREAFVDVEVVGLDREGRIDLADLEGKLSEHRYARRQKLVSLSAGSNITGLVTDTHAVARLAHRHGALVFFDYAAVAPYISIDMNRDEESYFDAVFFSPHKFLGGPGSSGILVINQRIYRNDLAPTTAGGGTVVYVGYTHYDFSADIETREKAGTPPILQTIKAALAVDLKDRIGLSTIGALEKRYSRIFLDGLGRISNIQTITDYRRGNHIPIISFNIEHLDRILHPKLVTKLLNDLFGIQTRAGCSCAGPYGHTLLGIDDETSLLIRAAVQQGLEGIKPGWVRLNLHYSFTEEDLDFLLRAVRFVAQHGAAFLRTYGFNFNTGQWQKLGYEDQPPTLDTDGFSHHSAVPEEIPRLRESYFLQAEAAARELETLPPPEFMRDEEELESLKSFYYAHRIGGPSTPGMRGGGQ